MKNLLETNYSSKPYSTPFQPNERYTFKSSPFEISTQNSNTMQYTASINSQQQNTNNLRPLSNVYKQERKKDRQYDREFLKQFESTNIQKKAQNTIGWNYQRQYESLSLKYKKKMEKIKKQINDLNNQIIVKDSIINSFQSQIQNFKTQFKQCKDKNSPEQIQMANKYSQCKLELSKQNENLQKWQEIASKAQKEKLQQEIIINKLKLEIEAKIKTITELKLKNQKDLGVTNILINPNVKDTQFYISKLHECENALRQKINESVSFSNRAAQLKERLEESTTKQQSLKIQVQLLQKQKIFNHKILSQKLTKQKEYLEQIKRLTVQKDKMEFALTKNEEVLRKKNQEIGNLANQGQLNMKRINTAELSEKILKKQLMQVQTKLNVLLNQNDSNLVHIVKLNEQLSKREKIHEQSIGSLKSRYEAALNKMKGEYDMLKKQSDRLNQQMGDLKKMISSKNQELELHKKIIQEYRIQLQTAEGESNLINKSIKEQNEKLDKYGLTIKSYEQDLINSQNELKKVQSELQVQKSERHKQKGIYENIIEKHREDQNKSTILKSTNLKLTEQNQFLRVNIARISQQHQSHLSKQHDQFSININLLRQQYQSKLLSQQAQQNRKIIQLTKNYQQEIKKSKMLRLQINDIQVNFTALKKVNQQTLKILNLQKIKKCEIEVELSKVLRVNSELELELKYLKAELQKKSKLEIDLNLERQKAKQAEKLLRDIQQLKTEANNKQSIIKSLIHSEQELNKSIKAYQSQLKDSIAKRDELDIKIKACLSNISHMQDQFEKQKLSITYEIESRYSQLLQQNLEIKSVMEQLSGFSTKYQTEKKRAEELKAVLNVCMSEIKLLRQQIADNIKNIQQQNQKILQSQRDLKEQRIQFQTEKGLKEDEILNLRKSIQQGSVTLNNHLEENRKNLQRIQQLTVRIEQNECLIEQLQVQNNFWILQTQKKQIEINNKQKQLVNKQTKIEQLSEKSRQDAVYRDILLSSLTELKSKMELMKQKIDHYEKEIQRRDDIICTFKIDSDSKNQKQQLSVQTPVSEFVTKAASQKQQSQNKLSAIQSQDIDNQGQIEQFKSNLELSPDKVSANGSSPLEQASESADEKTELENTISLQQQRIAQLNSIIEDLRKISNQKNKKIDRIVHDKEIEINQLKQQNMQSNKQLIVYQEQIARIKQENSDRAQQIQVRIAEVDKLEKSKAARIAQYSELTQLYNREVEQNYSLKATIEDLKTQIQKMALSDQQNIQQENQRLSSASKQKQIYLYLLVKFGLDDDHRSIQNIKQKICELQDSEQNKTNSINQLISKAEWLEESLQIITNENSVALQVKQKQWLQLNSIAKKREDSIHELRLIVEELEKRILKYQYLIEVLNKNTICLQLHLIGQQEIHSAAVSDLANQVSSLVDQKKLPEKVIEGYADYLQTKETKQILQVENSNLKNEISSIYLRLSQFEQKIEQTQNQSMVESTSQIAKDILLYKEFLHSLYLNYDRYTQEVQPDDLDLHLELEEIKSIIESISSFFTCQRLKEQEALTQNNL